MFHLPIIPVLQVICILGETLEPLDDDGIIPAYGFGDRVVKDKGVFPLKKEVGVFELMLCCFCCYILCGIAAKSQQI